MHHHHVTFATVEFEQAARLLQQSTARFGLSTEVYSPASSVVVGLLAKFPEIMSQPRGFGYWLWKPAIILDLLEHLPDGDTLLYTDADMAMVADPQRLFSTAERYPIVLFEHMPPGVFLMKEFTKRDCFVLLDADSERFWNTPQLHASIELYRVSDEARAFAREVFDAACNAQALTDCPNVCGLPNFPEFADHRHDQSILTIVARWHELPFFPDPTQLSWGKPRPDAARDIERPRVNYGVVFKMKTKRPRSAIHRALRKLHRGIRKHVIGPGLSLWPGRHNVAD
jgi:hypothetical protein